MSKSGRNNRGERYKDSDYCYNNNNNNDNNDDYKESGDNNDDYNNKDNIVNNLFVMGSPITKGDIRRVRKLENLCDNLKEENKWLKSKLRIAQARNRSCRLKKGDMITDYEWTGQEANLSERIIFFVGIIYFHDINF